MQLLQNYVVINEITHSIAQLPYYSHAIYPACANQNSMLSIVSTRVAIQLHN